MCFVALDDNRTAGRKRGRRIAARNGEGKRKVGCAEHCGRPDRPEHLAQVWTRSHRRVAWVVDRRFEVGAVFDDVGEESQLEGRAREFAVQSRSTERGFAIRRLDEQVSVGLKSVGHRTQHGGAPTSTQRLDLSCPIDGLRAQARDVVRAGLWADILNRVAGSGIEAGDHESNSSIPAFGSWRWRQWSSEVRWRWVAPAM